MSFSCNATITQKIKTLSISKFAPAPTPILKCFLRACLEYASPVWAPHLKKHKTAIENVQEDQQK